MYSLQQVMDTAEHVIVQKDLGEKDVQVGTIIMDNDTTTIVRARTDVNPALKKQCDKNHTLKQFTNKLYDLKKCKKL